MPRVVAIVAFHNEADVIEQTTRDLIRNGIEVLGIDDGSTDGGADLIRPLIGQGVLGIERLEPAARDRFDLRRLLARKEQVAAALDADWFINADADEIRESPWPDVTLADAIGVVDRLGWNAIDFAVLNFFPTHDRFQPGDDLRATFPYWTPGPEADLVQIRCWKHLGTVDLVSTGGHEARFAGRRVFPLRFILRHYPIRGQAHGEQKVWHERVPRFSEDEKVIGWHVQYDQFRRGQSFIRDPSTLTPYDPYAVRVALALHHRDVETAEAQLSASHAAAASAKDEVDRLRSALTLAEERHAASIDESQSMISALQERLKESACRETALASDLEIMRVRQEELTRGQEGLAERIDELNSALNLAQLDATHIRADLVSARTSLDVATTALGAMQSSRTWRWTKPFRQLASWIGIT